MNATHAETPGLEPVHQIVQRVLELGEDEQALFGMIEEPFCVEEFL